MIGNLINAYSNTTEREQHKIPLHVENWVARVLDHMNTDTDIRNEGNIHSIRQYETSYHHCELDGAIAGQGP